MQMLMPYVMVDAFTYNTSGQSERQDRQNDTIIVREAIRIANKRDGGDWDQEISTHGRGNRIGNKTE